MRSSGSGCPHPLPSSSRSSRPWRRPPTRGSRRGSYARSSSFAWRISFRRHHKVVPTTGPTGSRQLLLEYPLHRSATPPRDPQVVIDERLARVLLVAQASGERCLLVRRRRHRLRVHTTVDLERILDVGEEHERLPKVP